MPRKKRNSERDNIKKMVHDSLTPNKQLVQEGLKRMKKLRIKSPDTKEMKYWIKCKRPATEYYFDDKTKFIKKCRMLIESSSIENFVFSHPELIKNGNNEK